MWRQNRYSSLLTADASIGSKIRLELLFGPSWVATLLSNEQETPKFGACTGASRQEYFITFRLQGNLLEGSNLMSISMSNFEPATKSEASADKVAAAFANARHSIGYTLDQVAITTGLTVGELSAIESGERADPAILQRIASALGLPPTTFLAV